MPTSCTRDKKPAARAFAESESEFARDLQNAFDFLTFFGIFSNNFRRHTRASKSPRTVGQWGENWPPHKREQTDLFSLQCGGRM